MCSYLEGGTGIISGAFTVDRQLNRFGPWLTTARWVGRADILNIRMLSLGPVLQIPAPVQEIG
jgi:hypothetical protein